MGTDRKTGALRRSGAARSAAKREPQARRGDAGVAPAVEAAPVETTVVRRFRRGRWTLTAVPV